MRRNLFVLLSIAVLALVLSVSCDGSVSGKIGDTQMTPFYVKARKAFNVSSGVTLPEIGGIDLDKSLEAYEDEMEQFDEVIKNGGGEMSFDLNKGITLEAYLGIVNAIGVVFGPESYGFPMEKEGESIDSWEKNERFVTVHYKPKTRITVIIN